MMTKMMRHNFVNYLYVYQKPQTANFHYLLGRKLIQNKISIHIIKIFNNSTHNLEKLPDIFP